MIPVVHWRMPDSQQCQLMAPVLSFGADPAQDAVLFAFAYFETFCYDVVISCFSTHKKGIGENLESGSSIEPILYIWLFHH